MRLFHVVQTKLIGDNTLLLSLAPNRRRDVLSFTPGQYAAIGFKHNGRPSPMRCFSLVSSPRNPEIVQFAMRINGKFTNALSELEKGATVFLRGPFGSFTLNDQYDKNVIMMAGGIGITPFMSIARHAAETNSQRPLTLLYSCRSQHNIPFLKELTELEQRNSHFKVVYFITQGPTDLLKNQRCISGRIGEDWLRQLIGNRFDRITYFICGPKAFTGSLQNILLENKALPDRIITEEFTPTSSPASISTVPTYNIRRWTFALTGVTLVMSVGFFMVIDLARFVPKALQSSASADTQNQPATSSVSNPITSAPSSGTTAAQPSQQYYQQPITSVS